MISSKLKYYLLTITVMYITELADYLMTLLCSNTMIYWQRSLMQIAGESSVLVCKQKNVTYDCWPGFTLIASQTQCLLSLRLWCSLLLLLLLNSIATSMLLPAPLSSCQVIIIIMIASVEFHHLTKDHCMEVSV